MADASTDVGICSRSWPPSTCRETVAFAIAPNTATPTALPTERANMFVPVTMPRVCQSAEDCAAISTGEAMKPMPSPITQQAKASSHTELSGVTVRRMAEPAIANRLPNSAQSRNPTRRYTRPESEAAIGQPSVRAATANPATTAPWPSTPWAYSGTYDVRPMRITPTHSDVAFAPLSIRRRKTHSGRMGSAARDSTYPNTTSSTTDTDSTAMLAGESQAHATPPSSSPRMSSEAPTASRT